MPSGPAGQGAGLQNCVANLGGIAVSILTGWLKTVSGGYHLPMQAIWIFLITGIAAYLFLAREKFAPSPSEACT